MKTLWLAVLVLFGMGLLAGANLLSNAGFEDDVNAGNWSTTWGSFIRETWNNPPEGMNAAYLRGTWSGSDNGGIIQSVPGIPGTKYQLSAFFYFDNNWTASSRLLKIEFFDDASQLLDSKSSSLDSIKEGKWVKESVSATAPEGTTRVQVVLEASGIGAEGALGIDNVELSPVTP